MKLLLVQHGLAKSKKENPDRSLTEEGVKQTKKIAAWLGRQGVGISVIHHSGKTRAAQTAEIFSNRLAPTRGMQEKAGLNPNDDVLSYTQNLENQEEAVMVIGHLPFLARLAGTLVAGDPDMVVVKFINSGVVCLEREAGKWAVAWSIVPDILLES